MFFFSLAKVLLTLLEGNGRFNTMKEKKDSLDTPIHTAVELGCTESIKILLNVGASVGCLNSCGLTPLHLCIKNQEEECLKVTCNLVLAKRQLIVIFIINYLFLKSNSINALNPNQNSQLTN